MNANPNLKAPAKRRHRNALASGSPAALLRDEGGVSALEFGLFAPLLLFGFLMMVDISMAAYQRMTMDHVLRAGAQSAMSDRGTANVLKVIQSTAAEDTNVGSVSVERYCTCPGSSAVVECSTICEGTVATQAYYAISATKTFIPVVLPAMTFTPKLQVQVR